MLEENMNKTYWIIITLVILLLIGTALAKPTYDKISAQQSEITNITWSGK